MTTDVTFTPQAAALLTSLSHARRKEVRANAVAVAMGRNSNVAGIDDVRVGMLVADEVFLPRPGELAEGEAADGS